MKSPGRGKSFRDVVTDFLQQHDECSEAQKEFLQRLRDDDANRIDEVWRKFVGKQPKLADDDRVLFIAYLAQVWTIIELARYEAADKRLRHLMGVLDARLKKHWAKRFVNAPPDELPKILKEMELFSRGNESSPVPLSDCFPELDIRSDHEGSRLRTGFMRLTSTCARELTGDWCDDRMPGRCYDVGLPQLRGCQA